jgi:RNA polymerase sigma-70 factor (ECF subfamily)
MATVRAQWTSAPRMSSDSADLSATRGPRPGALGEPVAAAAADAPVVIPSFREIYDNYFAYVWRSAAHRGVPQAALDDVAQEVFIVIHRKLPEFEGRASLRLWIASIVRRVVADYVRKRGNRAAGDETLEREPASTELPSDEVERRAALSLLDELLSKMTDDQREVFVLCELEGLSGSEIAELTGINENTVWTRVRAARRIFQEGITRQRARLSHPPHPSHKEQP